METTPRSLLERLRVPESTDTRAADWAQFVEVFSPLFYSWARKLTCSSEDAADLVQDVFHLLLHKLPEFQHDGRARGFRTWVYTLLRNLWVDQRRRAAPQAVGDLDLLPDPAAADPAAAVSNKEYRDHLIACALRLAQRDFEPKTWMAFNAAVVEGRPATEVAAELGTSPAAVYAAVSRVRRRLCQELEGLLD